MKKYMVQVVPMDYRRDYWINVGSFGTLTRASYVAEIAKMIPSASEVRIVDTEIGEEVKQNRFGKFLGSLR